MTEAAKGSKSREIPSEGGARFRRLALALPDAEEHSHMGAPDFRVNGRIFATLAYQAKGQGTLKLTPEMQAEFIADAPEAFTPASGAWGRAGMTLVRLDAPDDLLAGALMTAHRHVLSSADERIKSARKKTGSSRRGLE
jgi:YjbR